MSIFKSRFFQMFLVICFVLYFRALTRFFFTLYFFIFISSSFFFSLNNFGMYIFYSNNFSNHIVLFYSLNFPIFLIVNFIIGLIISTINSCLEEDLNLSRNLIYLAFAGITIEAIYLSAEYLLFWVFFASPGWEFISHLLPFSIFIILLLPISLLSARYLIKYCPNVSKYIFEMVLLIYTQVKDLFSSIRLFRLSTAIPTAKKKLFDYLKEIKLVIPILIVAIIVRFYNIQKIGLRYWDEGYYALEAISLNSGKIFFYKPGHVILIALAFKCLGYHDYVSVLPSAILGSLTVFLAYDVGRKLFNRNTGVFAAAILAVSEYSILYSRSALSDANSTFFIALTFYLYISGKYLINKDKQSNLAETKVDHVTIRTPIVFLSGLVASYTFAVKETAILFIGFLILFEILYVLIKREDIGYTILALILFIMGAISGYFFIYFPLHASLRLGFLPEIYQSRFNTSSSVGSSLKINHIIHLLDLTGAHIFLLMIVGLFSLLKIRRRESLFVAGWFIFLLFFLSSIPHNEPRDFAQAIFPYILLSGKGTDSISQFLIRNMRNIRSIKNKEILFQRTLPLTVCILVIFSGIYLSMDTIQLESNAYKDVGEFLKNENSEGGFTSMTTLMTLYTEGDWRWLKEDSKESLIIAAERGNFHIVIDYMYYHSSYNIAIEILTKCEPIFQIYNEAALHRYTLLETFNYENKTEMILNDPYAKYIYVYEVKVVVDILYLE